MVIEARGVGVRQLYGGAITAQIPSDYTDISNIRQVPDNQEVFSHADTDRSVIIELLEMQQDIPPGVTAAQFHLNNIAEESGALRTQTHKLSALPSSDFPSLSRDDPALSVTVAYGTHVVSKFKDSPDLASHVDVYAACVRLPRASTDLVVAFNDPRVLHPQGSSALVGSIVSPEESDRRDAVLRTVLTSLKIDEWSLLES